MQGGIYKDVWAPFVENVLAFSPIVSLN